MSEYLVLSRFRQLEFLESEVIFTVDSDSLCFHFCFSPFLIFFAKNRRIIFIGKRRRETVSYLHSVPPNYMRCPCNYRRIMI